MTTAKAVLSGNGDDRQCLVAVFLRGGADGLSLVAPLEDDAYYSARPRLALDKKDALALDGFFGLNPRLAEFHPLFQEGALAFIHGAGSEDSTRSHFEAQDLMEHAGLAAGGWLGRFLRYRDKPSESALSAIAIGKALPESLRGAPAATVLQSLDDFTLGENPGPLTREIENLYSTEEGMLGNAARTTLDALRRIEDLRGVPYCPANQATYPEDTFGQGLQQVARLIKARVGLEAATLDLGGWDSHFAQGTLIHPLMASLSKGLSAFYRDLGPDMTRTTVVVMTEFGRRVRENSAFGTDHGRGSLMMVLAGEVQGGRVLGHWEGLKDEFLVGPGDLPVTVNYRNVLAPILAHQGAGGSLDKVFPEFELEPVALYGVV
jgi:uncharacterized protein (DUF1501 family)